MVRRKEIEITLRSARHQAAAAIPSANSHGQGGFRPVLGATARVTDRDAALCFRVATGALCPSLLLPYGAVRNYKTACRRKRAASRNWVFCRCRFKASTSSLPYCCFFQATPHLLRTLGTSGFLLSLASFHHHRESFRQTLICPEVKSCNGHQEAFPPLPVQSHPITRPNLHILES